MARRSASIEKFISTEHIRETFLLLLQKLFFFKLDLLLSNRFCFKDSRNVWETCTTTGMPLESQSKREAFFICLLKTSQFWFTITFQLSSCT